MYMKLRGLSKEGRKEATPPPPPPSTATRCEHCFVTFGTPPELVHHQTHHCFPSNPSRVLELFPPASAAIDTFSGAPVTVLGPASNPKFRHAAVSTRDANGLVCDIKISRLELQA